MFLVLMVPCYHKLIGTIRFWWYHAIFCHVRTRGGLLEDSSNKKGTNTGRISIQGGQL